MDVDADVALSGQGRLTGVDPDPNRELELTLGLLGGAERVRGTLEGNEEGVSLRVDLDSGVALEGLTQHAPVVGERVGVCVPELLE